MKLKLAAVALTALVALSGCGADSDGEPTAVHTANNGDVFNDADVEFATNMIQHHAQALQMVDMTVRRSTSPEVASLAEQIRGAQGPEIEQMTDWLTGWDQPVPETVRDHANAHGEGSGGMDHSMPGAMSEDEMADLESATGEEFERMWLEMMIEHHEGAIEMAKDEQKDGEFDGAVGLAASIETAQQDEIEAISTLLED